MTQDDADFTDGLRASLSDHRFALEPTSGARETIVAAARRRRRRREAAYATGGSLAVAGVLLGGFLLVNPQQPEEGSTLAEDTPTSQPAEARGEPGAEARSAPQPRAVPDQATPQRQLMEAHDAARARWMELGRSGYRSLRLGMSYDEIRETGLLADPAAPSPKDCVRYALANDGPVRGIVVSENVGLAAVIANRARTPEGIAVGSTRGELEQTYEVRKADNPPQYEIPTGPGYYLFRMDGERVSELFLVANHQDCGLP